MKEINYFSPAEASEVGEAPQHRFDLILDGERVGAAEVDYYSKPVPLYQLTELYVDFDKKGKGYASEIMSQVEAFLKKRKKPGVLVDGIIEGDPATGMYARRGWKEVPGLKFVYVYNWPDKLSLDLLKGYAFRYTDLSERKKSKV